MDEFSLVLGNSPSHFTNNHQLFEILSGCKFWLLTDLEVGLHVMQVLSAIATLYYLCTPLTKKGDLTLHCLLTQGFWFMNILHLVSVTSEAICFTSGYWAAFFVYCLFCKFDQISFIMIPHPSSGSSCSNSWSSCSSSSWSFSKYHCQICCRYIDSWSGGVYEEVCEHSGCQCAFQ